ncbi:Protein diaphanous 3 [Liparis tanakae]|uniref:Protein diaphanous 3 n=1 Tax=Liparis tanakae TaxID=230148 RepID=A0A4Z2H4V0_9TELE|nr:Protein diaphanous 3 [Liparis tanakae]
MTVPATIELLEVLVGLVPVGSGRFPSVAVGNKAQDVLMFAEMSDRRVPRDVNHVPAPFNRRQSLCHQENDETGVMDSLLEALQSGAAFRDRRKRAPRPRDNQQKTISPSSFRQPFKFTEETLLGVHVVDLMVYRTGTRFVDGCWANCPLLAASGEASLTNKAQGSTSSDGVQPGLQSASAHVLIKTRRHPRRRQGLEPKLRMAAD